MQISIFGLGYVGCVTAACLTSRGNRVIGVDINLEKVRMINEGRSPIIEAGLQEIITAGVGSGALEATTDPCRALLQTDLSIVCVGTPSAANGSLDLGIIKSVSQQIGGALAEKQSYHCVIYRSTVIPGTVRRELIPILADRSKKQVHRDFDVCFNPEFLREGSAISDFEEPPFTIIGCETDRGFETAARLYEGVRAPLKRTSYEVAEMVKYACNSFHALKVAFANEIGVVCKSLGVDSRTVMELFCQDTKLNISPTYLKPGFAFGGSCLPKDLRALVYVSKQTDVGVPLLSSILESNRMHVQRAVDRILATKRKDIGILGMSFKPGTDDLRESPIVSLIEALIGKGCHLRIFDPDVYMAKLFGSNKTFIEKEIPHISSLLHAELDEVVRDSEVIVIGKPSAGYREALLPHLDEKLIYDLVNTDLRPSSGTGSYDGICW